MELSKPRLIPFEQLFMGENVRLPGRLKLDALKADIAMVGLQNPIQCWKPPKQDRFEVLRGHRRLTAIGQIKTTNPDAYSKHFGKGVLCLVITDITEAEALTLKVDHGNELSLTDPFELQLCANLLFSANHTEEAVILTLAGLMDVISPMKASRRKELEQLEKVAQEAEAKGEKMMAVAKREEADKLVADYRRGMVQGLHNAYRCPAIVMSALAKQSNGKVAPEYTGEYLPELTSNDVKTLWKAHSQDMTILENGRPKFNQSRPGPSFYSVWDGLIAKAKVAKPEAVRAKAMSANDILKDVKEGKFKSEIACRMAAYHAGDKEAGSLLNELDKSSYVGDLLRAHAAEVWKAMVDKAMEIEKTLVENDKAQAVTEIETK